MPGLLGQQIGCTGMVKNSISFQASHLPCGRISQNFGVSEAGTAKKEKMRCYVSWKNTDARAVGPANRLHRDGEDQHQLSGLAPSLWENLPDV